MIKWISRTLGVLLVVAAGIFFGVLPGLVEAGRNRIAEHTSYPISTEAQALHADMLIGDLHADSLLWNRDLLKRGTRGHVDLPRMREGNVGLQIFTTVTKSPKGQNIYQNDASAPDNITPLAIAQRWPVRSWNNLTERGLHMANRLHAMEAKAPQDLKIIKSVRDLNAVIEAREAGHPQIGTLLGSEGGHIFEGEQSNVKRLYDAGFRLIGLTHFFDNALGGSLHGLSKSGLTEFGEAAVKDMLARNMIIDLAHASPKMARDVITLAHSSGVPLMVSHTGIYSNCPVPRNFSDELMRDIVANGGIVGIGFWKTVTCDHSPTGIARTIKAAIDVLGVDHVAIGSDFDGAVETPFDVSELAALTQSLLDANLTHDQIRAVMGENMVRFLRQTLPQ